MASEVRAEKNSTTAMPSAKISAAMMGSIAMRNFKLMTISPPAAHGMVRHPVQCHQSIFRTTFTEPSTADFSM